MLLGRQRPPHLTVADRPVGDIPPPFISPRNGGNLPIEKWLRIIGQSDKW